ncbi:hypothetical protein EKN06_05150 [Croceicoccus ponticola]|uniref:GNAT family N-acetyltransferase n=1 Tax=Croceicoccus ponticola TaxID=2217664 RepID=A0A437H1X6_9SPHN|nr:hypothetical protein [Croceicoccus ponticola]RVQ69556.1 hypothetical protein EKN06_05150 [Croceicoccus ponticola]
MFIRSENLFIRPAWPEDRAALSRIAVPTRHDPLRVGAIGYGLVITLPAVTGPAVSGPAVTGPFAYGAKLIGTALLHPLRRVWEAQVWLAPPWRHLGLFAESEDALAQLTTSLPSLSDRGAMPEMRPLIAA